MFLLTIVSLSKLPHNIHWKSQIAIFGISGYVI